MNTTLVGINSEITSEDERRRKHIARKTSKSITNSVRLAVVLFLLTVPVLAQLSSTGTISGTVKDSSGAIVVDATISVQNEGTHFVITSASSSDGAFVVPGLQPGFYTVSVQKQGFKAYSITHVEVHPALVADVPATLAVGAISSKITVSASSAQIQTTTPEISSELSEHQLSTLPMNGRNFQTLAALMPGAVNTSPDVQMGQGGFSTNNVMSVNGMGLSGTFYTVDGIWNENTGNMTQLSVTPNPDSIQEVRLLQNNYSAQYNLMGANVIVIQTRSGGSTFHGSAWEFFRNDALNTRNYFSKTVPTLRENIYGYSLSGPFFIPHLYNTDREKTFFFWSQQWSPVHIGSVIRGASPTTQERAGDFSSTSTPIIDPTTGKPFPGNVIPSSRLVPQAVALMNAMAPLPNNLAGGFDNYLNTVPQINAQRNDQIKVDQYFTQKYRLTAEYIGEHANTLYSNNAYLGPFSTSRENVNWPDYLTQATFTATLSPNMINNTSVAMNHRVVSLTQEGISLLSQLPSYSQTVPYTTGLGTDRLPEINFTGGWSTFGSAVGLPLINNSNLDLTVSDDWSWLRGKHYLQLGFSYYYGLKRQTFANNSNGQWNFTGATTGNPIADYLLGYAATLSQSDTETRPYMYYPVVSPWVQDTWKLTPHLTLSGGLRFLREPLPRTLRGTESIFDPATYSSNQAPIVNSNGSITPTANYNPTNGLIINGTNGVPLNFSDLHTNYWAPTIGFAYDVFGDGTTSIRGGYGIAYTRIPTAYGCINSCSNNPPFVQNLTLVNPSFPNAVGAAVKPAGAPTLTNEALNLQSAQVQSYSLSVQRQLANSWILSIAGAGNIARHLAANLNYNQPLPDGPYDYNPIINSGKVYTYLYGPYQGYGAITTGTSEGVAYWDALEASVTHRASDNLYLSAAYTWQHDLSDVDGTSLFGGGSVQNSYSLSSNYGNSVLNTPQVFSLSGIWTLPMLQGASAIKQLILGGWQYSDITTLQTGSSLDPGLSVSHQGLATRPSVTGLPIKGPKKVGEWFNKAAFSTPAAGYFGNASVGSILGPGTINFDMALYKTFHIKKQHNIEFRGELFNIFNHTNFATVSTNFGSGTYGQVISARDPRIAEFSLQYHF